MTPEQFQELMDRLEHMGTSLGVLVSIVGLGILILSLKRMR